MRPDALMQEHAEEALGVRFDHPAETPLRLRATSSDVCSCVCLRPIAPPHARYPHPATFAARPLCVCARPDSQREKKKKGRRARPHVDALHALLCTVERPPSASRLLRFHFPVASEQAHAHDSFHDHFRLGLLAVFPPPADPLPPRVSE